MSGSQVDFLGVGSTLHGYRIEKVLGQGGFGITYLALDGDSGLHVAIKEFFPDGYAVRSGESVYPKDDGSVQEYQYGLGSFLEEAHTLARFPHPNIVAVERIFEANNTAYMVLEYIDGRTFGDWVLGLGHALQYQELAAVLKALFGALELIHKNNFLHRDIAPDNIYIRHNGSPVLLDFGAARTTMAKKNKSLFLVVKQGFSPIEQYGVDAKAGPASDIYSLAATVHNMLTGKSPAEAAARMNAIMNKQKDPLPKLAKMKLRGYPTPFLVGLDAALEVKSSDRPQTINAWANMLFPDEPRSQALPPRPPEPPTFPAGDELPEGSIVENCRIGPVLSKRSFYTIYQAEDLTSNTVIIIKEYFPSDHAQRAEGGMVHPTNDSEFFWGQDHFIKEAWRFAEFQHPSMAPILRIVEANGTFYMLFGLGVGETLREWAATNRNSVSEGDLKRLIGSLLAALELIHQNGYLHLNISPDTIFILSDGRPVFSDLFNVMPEGNRSALLVKDGYSPYEQYLSDGQTGQWSDIYALGATLYWILLGGGDPVSAEQRGTIIAGGGNDPLLPLSSSVPSTRFSCGFLTAIALALKLYPTERPQSIEEWRYSLKI